MILSENFPNEWQKTSWGGDKLQKLKFRVFSLRLCLARVPTYYLSPSLACFYFYVCSPSTSRKMLCLIFIRMFLCRFLQFDYVWKIFFLAASLSCLIFSFIPSLAFPYSSIWCVPNPSLNINEMKSNKGTNRHKVGFSSFFSSYFSLFALSFRHFLRYFGRLEKLFFLSVRNSFAIEKKLKREKDETFEKYQVLCA